MYFPKTKLALRRIEKGWSQGRMALEVGLSLPTLAAAEQGTLKPSYTTKRKIEKYFGVNYEDLLLPAGKKLSIPEEIIPYPEQQEKLKELKELRKQERKI